MTDIPNTNLPSGDNPEGLIPITKKLEEENKRLEEALKKNEELKAKIAMSGRADAGQVSQIKEETPKEYMQRMIKGGKRE